MDSEFLTDEDLDKLVNSGVISKYSLVETGGWREKPAMALEIEFLDGNKLLVWSWSTPAPESSGLSFEAIVKSEN